MRWRHFIEILTLDINQWQKIIKTIGFLFIEDKNQIVFNLSMKNSKKLHYTRHKNWMIHMKDGDVLFPPSQRTPLDDFEWDEQALFYTIPKNSNLNSDYKVHDNSNLFLLDLRQFKKGIWLSVHLCDSQCVDKVVNAFKEKPNQQCFIYWKSTPKIILVAFDN